MPSYLPIDCEVHSTLELHIMHKDELTIKWQNEIGETQIQSMKPVDIITEKDVGEFLLLDDRQGTRHKIRLDQILSFKINKNKRG